MSDPPITDPTSDRASVAALRDITSSWWVLLLIGVLSVIAGAIVLAEPDHSLSVLVIVSGIYIVISSLLELWAVAFVSRSGTAALFGVLGIVIGILLIRHPINSILAATLLVGLWFVAVGVIRLVEALELSARRVGAGGGGSADRCRHRPGREPAHRSGDAGAAGRDRLHPQRCCVWLASAL